MLEDKTSPTSIDDSRFATQVVTQPIDCHKVIGHEGAKAHLFQAFTSHRPGHAWCLSGPSGIGKATLAWSLVKFLISNQNSKRLRGSDASLSDDSLKKKPLESDPNDPAVRRVLAGTHKDVLALEARAPRKGADPILTVDDIRGVGSFLHLSSVERGWRIAVIDGAESMTMAAANALLKLLEEPPRQCLILLICHSLGGVPATLLSRCRRLSLSPLPRKEFECVMRELLPELSEHDLSTLFSLSGTVASPPLGRPGWAFALHQNGATHAWQQVANGLATISEGQEIAIQGLSDPCNSQSAWYESLRLMIPTLSRRIALALSGGQSHFVTEPEIDLLALARSRGDSPALWLDIQDMAQAAFEDIDTGHMDRRLGTDALLRGLAHMSSRF